MIRYVGEDQFILIRDADGKMRLLLNNCVHRGIASMPCGKGNTSHVASRLRRSSGSGSPTGRDEPNPQPIAPFALERFYRRELVSWLAAAAASH